ncbi:bacteriocin [Dolosigranulum pigrum]|nr:bacteriocin [Dolosigranulum pigrum]
MKKLTTKQLKNILGGQHKRYIPINKPFTCIISLFKKC